jgi:hypothetical protein
MDAKDRTYARLPGRSWYKRGTLTTRRADLVQARWTVRTGDREVLGRNGYGRRLHRRFENVGATG